jgi:gas vesicle protein
MSFREVGFKTGSRILLKNLSRGGAGPDILPHFDEQRRYQWKMQKVSSVTCCMLSFLIGAMVGGGIALLTAPKSGKKTREQLKRMAEDAKEKAEDYYDEMKDKAAEATEKVQDYYQEAKRTVESSVDAEKKTFQKVTE